MLKIEPEGWYEHDQLRTMGLDGDALEEAVVAKQLRRKDVKGTWWYKGAWLIGWLEREEVGAS